MSIVGIIAEYNPFHNGHFYHLQQAKGLTNASHAVVIMSPNFVQRGAPAISNKWVRTKMALLSGADLVIELPTPYAIASAEFFAAASVSLLHHTGIVTALNFGSESNNIDLLTQISKILVQEPDPFKVLLKENLDTGINFPSARAKAFIDYAQFIPDLSNHLSEIEEIIQTPNNILGIEYLKALNKLNSPIVPTTLKRKGAGYHESKLSQDFSSATAIRHEISKGNLEGIASSMPKDCYELLAKDSKAIDLSSFLCYRLLFSTPNDLRRIMGITEGMENRILNTFKATQNINEIAEGIKSKRFTQTTTQRMLLNIILQISKADFNRFQAQGGPQYIRVLGFRKSADHLLTQLKAKATLPIVMNIPRDYENLPPLARQMLDLEIRSTNLYSAAQSSSHRMNLDYTTPLVIV